ncbi:hypothetical protein H4Q32_003903 [Labeo rohita]|uniref:Wnt ligand secretion mediator n=1 Tax=Labeo rohita TaxID=84645 RepID=A0ABQ8MX62_LABRO|nr:hypothetical protein H4Q32_003903 [Labeo rohita]
MAGAIIENMSTKKLVIVGVILLLFQAFSFMVGGLIAPSPTTAVHYLATKCVDTVKTHHKGSKWFMPWGPDQCSKIRDFDEAMAKRIEANNIVFAVHIPLPNREMSAWFQFMLVILQFDIAFKMQNQIEDGALVTMDTYENEGRYYDCDLLPFMEVGSVAHKYYLLNIRLPVNERKKVNIGIGEIKDIRLVSIHQNGGFTKVWFAMKTFLTPSVLIIMIWIIFALGISMTFINIPVEWFSVGFNWTWMLLFGDIRQGIFYAMLLSFWIVFCGEHLMDQTERNRFSVYWKQVGPIVFGSFCLFIFDMCERGVQLKNPFYSIWASDVGTELAVSFWQCGIEDLQDVTTLTEAGADGFHHCSRNLCMSLLSVPVLHGVPSVQKHQWEKGLIFRFKFLMLVTLACAAMTVIFFIISQVNEGHWHWGGYTVQVNSAFFTGIYGMWNLYVFALMFLYAPSHKRYGDEQSSADQAGNSGEDIQLTTTITHVDGPTEIYKMTGKEAQE